MKCNEMKSIQLKTSECSVLPDLLIPTTTTTTNDGMEQCRPTTFEEKEGLPAPSTMRRRLRPSSDQG